MSSIHINIVKSINVYKNVDFCLQMPNEHELTVYDKYQAYMTALQTYLELPPIQPVPRPPIDAYRKRFVEEAERIEHDNVSQINRDLRGLYDEKLVISPPDGPLQWHAQFVQKRYSRDRYLQDDEKHSSVDKSTAADFQMVTLPEALQKFFHVSRHITYAMFLSQLHRCFDQLIEAAERRSTRTLVLPMPFYDTQLQDVSKTTGKSNFWVAQHLYQYLKKRESDLALEVTFGNERPFFGAPDAGYSTTGGDFFVILDDASYTSNQLCDNTLECIREAVRGNDFVFFVVPFLSVEAKIRLETFAQKNMPVEHDFADSQTFASLAQHMTRHEIARLFRYRYGTFANPEPDMAQVIKDCANKYPIYFDHKTPDYMSGFPDLYSGVLPVVGNEGVPDPIRGCRRCRTYPYVLNEHGMTQTGFLNTADPPPIPPYKP